MRHRLLWQCSRVAGGAPTARAGALLQRRSGSSARSSPGQAAARSPSPRSPRSERITRDRGRGNPCAAQLECQPRHRLAGPVIGRRVRMHHRDDANRRRGGDCCSASQRPRGGMSSPAGRACRCSAALLAGENRASASLARASGSRVWPASPLCEVDSRHRVLAVLLCATGSTLPMGRCAPSCGSKRCSRHAWWARAITALAQAPARCAIQRGST